MEVNSHQMNSSHSVRKLGLRASSLLPTIPQQNGVAERKNRTIMEVVKAMIHDQDLLMHLWAEATKTTVYVQNKSPHRVLGNKTPEEMFTGEKPEFNDSRIFGYPVYVYVPKGQEIEVGPFRQEGYICWI